MRAGGVPLRPISTLTMVVGGSSVAQPLQVAVLGHNALALPEHGLLLEGRARHLVGLIQGERGLVTTPQAIQRNPRTAVTSVNS